MIVVMKKKVNNNYLFLGGIIVVFFVLFAISFFVSPVFYANDIPSPSESSFVNFGTSPPCGNKGIPGVEFCGTCYDCGIADNVCPQLFGVDCVDPDCEGKL